MPRLRRAMASFGDFTDFEPQTLVLQNDDGFPRQIVASSLAVIGRHDTLSQGLLSAAWSTSADENELTDFVDTIGLGGFVQDDARANIFHVHYGGMREGKTFGNNYQNYHPNFIPWGDGVEMSFHCNASEDHDGYKVFGALHYLEDAGNAVSVR